DPQQHAADDEVGQPRPQQQCRQRYQRGCVGVGRKRGPETVDVVHHDRLAALRSMITPTLRAPRTAPGLLSFRRTWRIPNSSSRIAATRSASVSTRPNRDASTKPMILLLMAL